MMCLFLFIIVAMFKNSISISFFIRLRLSFLNIDQICRSKSTLFLLFCICLSKIIYPSLFRCFSLYILYSTQKAYNCTFYVLMCPVNTQDLYNCM